MSVQPEDIYSLSEWYQFESTEEGATVALFAILKELKQLNKTLKEKKIMAVPEGVITTSEIFVEDTEPTTAADEAIAEAIITEEETDEATN